MSSSRDRLLLGGGFLLLIAAVAGFIWFAASGQFLGTSGCWETQQHPETNATFSTVSEYKQAVRNYGSQNTEYTDSEIERLLDSKEYRTVTQNGTDVVQTRDPDLICDERRTVS